MLNPTEASAVIMGFQSIDANTLTIDEQWTFVKAFSDFAEKVKPILDAHTEKPAVKPEDELVKVFVEAFAKSIASGMVKGTNDAED